MASVNKDFRVRNGIQAGSTIVAPASATSPSVVVPFRIPHGTALTAGNSSAGDIWTTTSGMYANINGAVVGPFGSGGGASVTVSDTAPVSPSVGNLWYKSSTGILFIYYDSFWVQVGSAGNAGNKFDSITTLNGSNTAATLWSDVTTGSVSIGTGITSGSMSFGGTSTSGTTININPTTLASTTNIATGNNSTAVAKAINIGTGGSASGTTTIAIGSTVGTTTTINGTINLPSSTTKVGNTSLIQGGTVNITFPNIAGTLIGSGDTGTVTTAMLASSSSTTTGVTYAKMQYVSAQYRLLGRITAAAGVVEELTPDNIVTTLGQATVTTSRQGTGAVVLATSPTLTTPTIGVATATSINKVAITAPTTSATLTLADGSTLATSGAFSTTLTATATTNVTLPTTGILATTSNKLSSFASTTSAELAGVISDETGFSAGALLVFSISPALTGTPTAPTATAGTNTTQIATTEFVQTATNNVIINTQTASYQLALTDVGKVVEMNVGTANNLTVPPNGTIAFPIGTTIDIVQYGAGQTTIVAGSGVIIRSKDGALNLSGQYSAVSLYKRGTNEWIAIGDLTV